MSNAVKRITSENPIEQVWKHLRLFQHVPFVIEAIRTLHNIDKGEQSHNIKKQATQIDYCIRQAEQYFTAALHVGNATKPNLLYYGCINLSQALVLLRNDGTYSLDARRKEKKHNHHGLELGRGKAQGASHESVESFLDSITCCCYRTNGGLWGHFPLFYKSLTAPTFTIHETAHEGGRQIYLEGHIAHTCAPVPSLQELADEVFDTNNLMKQLPDMYYELERVDIKPDLCPGRITSAVIQEYRDVPLNVVNDAYPGEHQVNREIIKSTYIQNYFFYNVSEAEKVDVVNFYAKVNPKIQVVSSMPSKLHLSLTVESQGAKRELGYLPDITEDTTGTKFYILKPEKHLPEAATILIVLFCFGMLSRYYPDVWMRALDRNIQLAEFVDSFLSVASRKFPNLLLDQMTGIKHNFVLPTSA